MSALMKCGHTTHATDGNGAPVCIICAGISPGAREVDTTPPDMTGRMARCSYDNGRTHPDHPEKGCRAVVGPVPSSPKLAFFEYRGPGSPYAEDHCKSGFTRDAHDPDNPLFWRDGVKVRKTVIEDRRCRSGCTNAGDGFKPRGPAAEDRYFCGCWGWD